MPKLKMEDYQKVVKVKDLNPEQVQEVLAQILDRLKLEVRMESTPDYVSIEVVEKED